MMGPGHEPRNGVSILGPREDTLRMAVTLGILTSGDTWAGGKLGQEAAPTDQVPNYCLLPPVLPQHSSQRGLLQSESGPPTE